MTGAFIPNYSKKMGAATASAAHAAAQATAAVYAAEVAKAREKERLAAEEWLAKARIEPIIFKKSAPINSALLKSYGVYRKKT
jgi:hypothetical protein